MSTYVHLHVCFACDNNEDVAALARRHLAQFPNNGLADIQAGSWYFEAQQFLSSLAGRTGPNFGPKGGLSLWGMVGKNSNAAAFCERLRPFWTALLSDVEGGPCGFERVVVFEEREGAQAANAYQIGWDDNERDNRTLVIKKCERLPFSWGQY